MSAPVIAIITDFGNADSYVGQMKCVIHSISPQVRIIDITHEVEFADIRHAGFFIESTEKYLPPETILITVVDPGVGTARKIIACKTAANIFIAPDNGCLTTVLKKYPAIEIRSVENKRFFLPETSFTFHGRDIFAPAAAHLANGRDFSAVGPIYTNPLQLPESVLTVSGDKITFTVQHIDRFGNIITNIPLSYSFNNASVWHFAGLNTKTKYCSTFNFIEPDYLGIIPGSSGYYEIAACRNSAAEILKQEIGSICEFCISS